MTENQMILVGNVATDPELRYTPTGTALCRFTVAHTPRVYDKAAQAWKDGDTLFMQCQAWKDLGENLAESLAKGARVIVVGRLRQRQWETKEGEKRTVMELDVEDVGASMRFAQVSVRKLARQKGDMTPATDTEPPF